MKKLLVLLFSYSQDDTFLPLVTKKTNKILKLMLIHLSSSVICHHSGVKLQ